MDLFNAYQQQPYPDILNAADFQALIQATIEQTPVMQKATPQQNSPFALRGIDPQQIWRNYNNGFTASITFPSSKLPALDYSSDPVQSHRDATRYDSKYSESSGGVTTNYITNYQDDFEYARQIVEQGGDLTNIHLLKKGLCLWCRYKLAKLPEGQYPVGIPSKVIEKKREGKLYYKFDIDPKFCCFECAYASALVDAASRFAGHSGEVRIMYLKFLFELLYPGQELIATQDWRNHVCNGGTLNDHDFFNKRSCYVKTGNVVTIPTKPQYMIIKRAG